MGIPMAVQSQSVISTYSYEAIYRRIGSLISLEELYQLLEREQVKTSSLTNDRREI